MSSILDQAWFLFSVRPTFERQAQTVLQRCGYSVAVPCVAHWRRKTRHQKSRQKVLYPAIPSYVLVGFSEQPIPWLRFQRMPFVGAPVGFDGKPAQLDSEQVARFLVHPKFDEKSLSELFRNMRTYHEYDVGDLVELDAPGFDGVRGRVVELDRRNARILIPMFGSERQVSVPVDAAIKVAELTEPANGPTSSSSDPTSARAAETRDTKGKAA